MLRRLVDRLLVSALSRAETARLRRRDVSLRSWAVVDPSTLLLPEAKFENLRADPEAIVIGPSCAIRGNLLVFAHGGRITIGSHCYVGESSRIWSAASVTIGNRVLVSHSVEIHDNNSHPLDHEARHQHFVDICNSGHPRDMRQIRAAPVEIGDDVWIGFGATILKGVRIGARSIIGAGAIVTNDVPPDSTVVAISSTKAQIVVHGPSGEPTQ